MSGKTGRNRPHWAVLAQPMVTLIGGGMVVARVWRVFDPVGWLTFQALMFPWVRLGLTVAGGAGLWSLLSRPHPKAQTHEDIACGWYITGVPGSGKTRFAYLKVREFCRQGWGFIWLSVKSSLSLLPHLTPEAGQTCLLFQPHSTNPLGLNFLRAYVPASEPGASTERELLADQTAELFSRLHPAMSGNMRELIRMGTLALMLWADRSRVEVTFWELYRLFQEPAFRTRVLTGAPKPIRDAFSDDEVRKQTLQAVKVQLRRSVTSETLLVALSQRDGIDLWDVIENERWLVCDTQEAILGPAVAAFLCQVIASRVQMLTSRRQSGSRPFACFSDEFQRYTNPTFAQAIEMGREYGLAWFLIHQTNAGQDLGREVHGAVAMCQNRYYFQQTAKDARAAAEVFGGRWTAEEFSFLPARHFKAVTRVHGRPVVFEGKTPDLPPVNPNVAAEIIRRNGQGPCRAAILAEIQSRKVVARHDDDGQGPVPAAGAV